MELCSKCNSVHDYNGNCNQEKEENTYLGEEGEIFVKDQQTFPCWINVYHVSLAYGGSEEGGWWYDEGEVLEAVQADDQEQLDYLLKMLRKRYELDENNNYLYKDQYDHPNFDRVRNRSYSSVASRGEYRIYIQPNKGENFPEERPHYE